MFAPPNRYGLPASSRCVPDRVTNELWAGPDLETRAAAARRHAVGKATRIRASSGTVRFRGRGDSSRRLAAATAAVLVAALIPASGAATKRADGISFSDHGGQLVVTATAYRLTLSTKNGKIL